MFDEEAAQEALTLAEKALGLANLIIFDLKRECSQSEKCFPVREEIIDLMNFIPLYFQDKLTIVNPAGTIGVLTLWSKVDYVMERFRQAGIDLDPATSPIAVFGTLYGNGLRELLRNLLYNPQIRTLLVCGRNRSGSLEDLQAFFDAGLESAASPLVSYETGADGAVVQTCRIKSTNRLIDNLVRPDNFRVKPQFLVLGEPKDEQVITRLQEIFQNRENLTPKTNDEGERQEIPLPQVAISHFPSQPQAHTVVRDTPLEAWQELLFVISRFGHPVKLAKGERLELQNVKVVVTRPVFESEEALREHHFDPEKLHKYQRDFLRGEKGPDETYSYGHRLRAYFGNDNLACMSAPLAGRSGRPQGLSHLVGQSSGFGSAKGPTLFCIFILSPL